MDLRIRFVMNIMINIILIITGCIGIFLLDNITAIYLFFLIGLIAIGIKSMFNLFNMMGKVIDKDWTKIFDLRKKLDEEEKYIGSFITKFKLKIIDIDKEVHFTSDYEFIKMFKTAECLMIVIKKIKENDDLTKYEDLIDGRITSMITVLKEYENFWDNYFASREGTNKISEEILKKEQQEYDMIKNKYDILKRLQFLEMEFAKIVIYKS